MFIKRLVDALCVCVSVTPRESAGPRNYLNGRSCVSVVTGCFNGRTLWAIAQGNDRFGCRNALILSPWQEGMLPLSDGLIAPALIDRQPGPLRSPGNTDLSTHTHKPITLLSKRNSGFPGDVKLSSPLKHCLIWQIDCTLQIYLWWKCNQKAFRPGEERKKQENGWGESRREIRACWKPVCRRMACHCFGTLAHSRTRIPSRISHSTAECIHGQIL